MSSISERIKQIRKDSNLTQTEFGQRLGAAQNTIATYESGRREPQEVTLTAICREFGVNMEWLKNGTGNPYNDADDDLARLIGVMLKGENDTAKKVFKAFAKLSADDWKSIEKLIDEKKKKKKERH